jgi:hypothetical protein
MLEQHHIFFYEHLLYLFLFTMSSELRSTEIYQENMFFGEDIYSRHTQYFYNAIF